LENLANGYEKLNRLPQADSSMNEALKFANLNQYITYGRTLIIQKRKDRALDILLGAKEKFGDVYVVNNNLSYAYSAKADYTKALVFANKALAQAGSPEAKTTVAANIEKLKAGKDINQ
jgi:tetratricopeptide (TPR) repeat protein